MGTPLTLGCAFVTGANDLYNVLWLIQKHLLGSWLGAVLLGAIAIGFAKAEILHTVTPDFSSVSSSFCTQSTCFKGNV